MGIGSKGLRKSYTKKRGDWRILYTQFSFFLCFLLCLLLLCHFSYHSSSSSSQSSSSSHSSSVHLQRMLLSPIFTFCAITHIYVFYSQKKTKTYFFGDNTYQMFSFLPLYTKNELIFASRSARARVDQAINMAIFFPLSTLRKSATGWHFVLKSNE